MRIALVSLDQAWEDKPANLERCAQHAAAAAVAGADLVVFPELTLTGFTMNAAAVAEAEDESPTVAAFRDLARAHDLHIAFGVALHGERHPRNTVVVLGRNGVELGRYAKLHPFSHADEDEHYEPGDSTTVVRIARMNTGLTICYDLRFPELYSSLAPSCDAILVIANWPAPRIEHWHTLLRARALDCQCFIIAVNRTGTDGTGMNYPRSSCIVHPRGTVLQPDQAAGELDIYAIDAGAAAQYRRTFPTLRDRRPDLYRSLLTP
jgi:predicted amidohydrolase